MNDGDDDRELVSRCLHGELAAWQALIDRYQRLVYSLPKKMGLPSEDCADVFQAVCVALFKGLSTLRDVPRLSSWLVTTAHRESLRVLRRRKTEHRLVEEDLAAAGAVDVGAISVPADRAPLEEYELKEPLPEAELIAIEEQALIRRALAALPERCRDLLSLLYYDRSNPSYEEIEARLKIPIGAIGPTRSRCLNKLRARLVKLGFS